MWRPRAPHLAHDLAQDRAVLVMHVTLSFERMEYLAI
jgi:hypothetical protein